MKKYYLRNNPHKLLARVARNNFVSPDYRDVGRTILTEFPGNVVEHDREEKNGFNENVGEKKLRCRENEGENRSLTGM